MVKACVLGAALTAFLTAVFAQPSHSETPSASAGGITYFRVPEFFVPLLIDAKGRIDNRDYNLDCLQFTLGRQRGLDGYFVLVNHTDAWLRANGYLEEGQSYRGGHAYCGLDVSFQYDASGQFQKLVFVK
jgi:hypothetical protein